MAIGFAAGSAIGDGGDASSSLSSKKPARIVTRQGSVDLPTMRGVARVPPLDVRQQTVEATVESTDPIYTPNITPEEAAAAEEAPESQAPVHESAPEVTVAPNE